jgi:hypothetical protein
MRLLAASSSGRIDLDTRAFFVSNMVDALGHATMLRRPAGASLRRARAESVRAPSWRISNEIHVDVVRRWHALACACGGLPHRTFAGESAEFR